MTVSATVASSGARASSQARTAEGTALAPPGSAMTLPNVATRAVLRGGLAGGQHGGRVGQHRVAAVGEPGRARVVGAAGEVEPPPAVRPDALGQAEGGALRGERAALLDVQFDEGADAGQQVVAGAEVAGVVARGGHGLRPA